VPDIRRRHGGLRWAPRQPRARTLPPAAGAVLSRCLPALQRRAARRRDNAAVGFGEIVAGMSLPRDPARVPLVTASSRTCRSTARKLQFGSCTVDYHINPRSFEAFELNLVAIEAHDTLQLRAHGNSDLYSRGWLEWRVRELDTLLRNGCASPDIGIGRLDLLPARSGTPWWGGTARRPTTPRHLPGAARGTADRPVTGARGAQARRTRGDLPRAGSAVESTGACAASAPFWQRRTGGICLERSVEMVAAVLAVLKAGRPTSL